MSSARTAVNWKKYTPAQRVLLRRVAKNRAGLLAALEAHGIDFAAIGYQRLAGADNVVAVRFKNMLGKPTVFVTYRGLIEIARKIGLKWKEKR